MKKISLWIAVALVLRLVLSATAVHPDTRGHNLAGYLIAQKGQLLSFYDYLSLQPRSDPWVILYRDDLFIYPPLAYLVHGISNLVLYPLYPQQLFLDFITDMGSVRHSAGLGTLMILLKLPYLVADLLCLWVIRKLVEKKDQYLVSLVWLFNPITIYASYMVGQFDIFIALFILLSLQLKSPIMLGLAASFKPFPLFFLPFMPGSKIKNITMGVGTYLLTMLPYLSSAGFRQYALFAPQTDKLVYAKILLSGSQYLPIFFVGLFILFWWNYFSAKTFSTWEWFAAVALLFFSVTHFHPQWFVWATPMLALSFTTKPGTRLPILALVGTYLLLVLLFEPSLSFGLFDIKFSLFDFINTRYPADQLASITRAFLAASSIGVFLGRHKA